MSEKNFADGIRVTRRDNAPDFVLCQLGIHVDRFAAWAGEHVNQAGFVNVDIKRSKNGNIYAELNDWKPDTERPGQRGANVRPLDEDDSEIPF